ncbi:MAG: NAD(P)-dependent oxidoreductase [Planctomycetaceae bacterium]
MERSAVDPRPIRTGVDVVGWIGTGIMGGSMATRLLAAGHRLVVHTRSPDKARSLLDAGARWAATPAEAAAGAAATFVMVGHPSDVDAVVFGEQGVCRAIAPGTTLVDHTTSSPALAERIAAAVAERGARSLDAPVSGGDRGAREGTLTVMVGGDDAAREAVAPCFAAIAGRVVACGGPGSGQRTKLVNQIAIASGMIGMCEALLFASRAGLDLETTLAAIGSGAAGSWSLSNLAPRILRGDLAPGFLVEHFVKDMGLALEECRRMDLRLPGLALAETLYRTLVERGLGRLGTQGLVLALAEQAGVRWAPAGERSLPEAPRLPG